MLTGKALVIFKSNDAAEDAISKLQSGCLILEDGRYLYHQYFYFLCLCIVLIILVLMHLEFSFGDFRVSGPL